MPVVQHVVHQCLSELFEQIYFQLSPGMGGRLLVEQVEPFVMFFLKNPFNIGCN